jgi:hypothetical protein
MTISAEAAGVVAEVRREVAALHAELPRNGLVVWTAGNVSARVPGHDLLVIKPSGVSYDELTPENMVVCDLEGRLVEGEHAPSSDTAAHAYVYKHMPEVNGVVHTHSTYATAWAARAEPIRRVRRRDPDRTVRPDRRRLDRPGHRRDPARAPLEGGPDAEPRALHHRCQRQGGGQGRRAV